MHTEIDGDILSRLISLEPIFHRFEHISGRSPARADFNAMMAPEFFEIGASGRLYSRDFILDILEERFRTSASKPDLWQTSEFRSLRLAEDTWLLSYVLRQQIDGAPRVSRRTTIWKRAADGWQILFHQGTLADAVEAQDATVISKEPSV
jgi:hypothetical protein